MNLKYRGKVTRVGKKYLTVVLYEDQDEIVEGVVGEVDKILFPPAGYKIGQVFDYSFSASRQKVSVSYKLVKPKPIIAEGLARLKRDVRRQLKGIDLDKL